VFYYVGLDLGQSQDYTALAVLETQLWTGPLVDWAYFGVFFPDGVEPGGWVSPSAWDRSTPSVSWPSTQRTA
jgi:hypothetical protein